MVTHCIPDVSNFKETIMRKLLIGLMAIAAIACGEDGGSPLSPSATPGTTTNPLANIISPPDNGITPPPRTSVEPAPELVDPRSNALYNIVGPSGCLDGTNQEWAITLNEYGYRFRTASFHDEEAGCSPTTSKPGGHFEVRTDVPDWEPGLTTFSWSAGIACGRYQADIAIGDYENGGQFTTIVGIVINMGENCTEPVPPIVIPPPIEPPPVCVAAQTSEGLRGALLLRGNPCDEPECDVNDPNSECYVPPECIGNCNPNTEPVCILEDVPGHGTISNPQEQLDIHCPNCELYSEFASPNGWESDGYYSAIVISSIGGYLVYYNISPGDTFSQGTTEDTVVTLYISDTCEPSPPLTFCEEYPLQCQPPSSTPKSCPIADYAPIERPMSEQDWNFWSNTDCPDCIEFHTFFSDDNEFTNNSPNLIPVVKVTDDSGDIYVFVNVGGGDHVNLPEGTVEIELFYKMDCTPPLFCERPENAGECTPPPPSNDPYCPLDGTTEYHGAVQSIIDANSRALMICPDCSYYGGFLTSEESWTSTGQYAMVTVYNSGNHTLVVYKNVSPGDVFPMDAQDPMSISLYIRNECPEACVPEDLEPIITYTGQQGQRYSTSAIQHTDFFRHQWVLLNACDNCNVLAKDPPHGSTHEWFSDDDYPVVLIKANGYHFVWTDVMIGDSLAYPDSVSGGGTPATIGQIYVYGPTCPED